MAQKIHWLCVCFCLLSSSVLALEVHPKNPVPIYSLVRVTLDQGERAFVFGNNFSPVDLEYTKTGICFTGAPGRYAIISITADGQSQALVEIGGTFPPPPPGPPDPNPPVPIPDKWGMVRVTADAKVKILPEGRPFIPAVAANFQSIASAIAAGGVADRKTAVLMVQEANKATLGTQIATWHAWGKDVGKAMDALTNSGRVTTLQQYSELLSDIARGLTQGLYQ